MNKKSGASPLLATLTGTARTNLPRPVYHRAGPPPRRKKPPWLASSPHGLYSWLASSPHGLYSPTPHRSGRGGAKPHTRGLHSPSPPQRGAAGPSHTPLAIVPLSVSERGRRGPAARWGWVGQECGAAPAEGSEGCPPSRCGPDRRGCGLFPASPRPRVLASARGHGATGSLLLRLAGDDPPRRAIPLHRLHDRLVVHAGKEHHHGQRQEQARQGRQDAQEHDQQIDDRQPQRQP